MPENLLTVPLELSRPLRDQLEQAVRRWGIPLLGGFTRVPRVPGTDGYRSSMLWVTPEAGVARGLDKYRAIPLFESDSAALAILQPLIGEAAAWPKVREASRATALDGPVPLAPVLCFEALFPAIASLRRVEGTLAIVNPADDGWVESSYATRQLVDFASFRAIEQRLPYVRIAHGGLSVWVDEYGVRLAELPLDRRAHMTVLVAGGHPPTSRERWAIGGIPLAVATSVWWLARRLIGSKGQA